VPSVIDSASRRAIKRPLKFFIGSMFVSLGSSRYCESAPRAAASALSDKPPEYGTGLTPARVFTAAFKSTRRNYLILQQCGLRALEGCGAFQSIQQNAAKR